MLEALRMDGAKTSRSRAWSWAGLVLLVGLGGGGAARASAPDVGTDVITLDERVPAVMVVLTPRDFVSSTPTSEFIEAARRVLRARTRLALSSAEQAGVDAGAFARCGAAERLGCWLLAARPDALAAEASSGARDRPRFLFVLSVLPSEEAGEDRLSTFILDADDGTARWRGVDRSREDWRERVEGSLFEVARQTEVAVVRASDRRVLADYFSETFERALRPLFERTGDWEPYGSIVVKASEAGLVITVDGVEVGVTAGGPGTTLVDVTPGRRRITVGPARAAATLEVDVVRGARVEASFDALLARVDLSDRTPVLRHSLVATGAALGVAGAALAIVGAVQAGDVRAGCVLRAGDTEGSCAGLGAPGLAWDPSRAPTLAAGDVNPRSVAVLPLGLALTSAGAVLAGGTWLVDDDAHGDHALWIPAVVGLATGLLVYGTGAALGAP